MSTLPREQRQLLEESIKYPASFCVLFLRTTVVCRVFQYELGVTKYKLGISSFMLENKNTPEPKLLDV